MRLEEECPLDPFGLVADPSRRIFDGIAHVFSSFGQGLRSFGRCRCLCALDWTSIVVIPEDGVAHLRPRTSSLRNCGQILEAVIVHAQIIGGAIPGRRWVEAALHQRHKVRLGLVHLVAPTVMRCMVLLIVIIVMNVAGHIDLLDSLAESVSQCLVEHRVTVEHIVLDQANFILDLMENVLGMIHIDSIFLRHVQQMSSILEGRQVFEIVVVAWIRLDVLNAYA